MVSSILTAIVVLLIGGAIASYLVAILNEPEIKIEKPRPSFIDFSLKQEGANILIQNGGINNISVGSLRIYFGNTLTQITNKNDIPPASFYTIKLLEFPSFEGKMNITIALDNVNRSLEIVSIREITAPVSEIFPPIPTKIAQPIPSVKIHTLSIDIIGGGKVIINPNATEFEEGTELEVNATPDVNHTFGYWFLDGDTVNGNSQIVKMDRNHSLKAIFLIRSDVDCVRRNPAIAITNSTIQNNISMTFLVNVTNRDYKCDIESFELSHSCPSEFNCNLQNRLISIQSSNSSETVDFFVSSKNMTALSAGNYTFSVTVKNRADTRFSSSNSTFYEIK